LELANWKLEVVMEPRNESGRWEVETRKRSLLLLTEEEASRLADALKDSHVPASILILEAIQAGLQTLDLTTMPGRRTRTLYFRIPTEIRERVKQLATQRHVSQQSLTRHFLFTYISHPPWKKPDPPRGCRNPRIEKGAQVET
jgi:hypothetical protein